MKQPPATAGLVGQQQALDAYFDALFNDDTSVPTHEQTLAPGMPVQFETETGGANAAGEQVVDVEPAAPRGQQQEGSGDTAGSVRVQVFNVAGLTLALPLEYLQAVVENHSGLTAVSASPEKLAGTLDWNGGQVPVVDTARLVLPDERVAKLDEGVAQRCRHLLIIDGGRWALGCGDIGEVIELADAEITWRTAAGKRPWLAGMAAQRRCALLDTGGLISLLEGEMA